jgi:hypothetical protein
MSGSTAAGADETGCAEQRDSAWGRDDGELEVRVEVGRGIVCRLGEADGIERGSTTLCA